METRVIAALLALVLAGCATPVDHSQAPRASADKDTSYSVTERPGGFTITVDYGRYQFIPESSAVAAACKQALTSLAHDVAEQRGRKIAQVNEQRIKLSMGRNGFAGTTTCNASAPVDWAD